jgi:hypothetical protein
MKTPVYLEIVSEDTEGQSNNPRLTLEENAERARLVRSFVVPDRFSENAARKPLRTVNILAAFVSADWTWTLSDFARLSNLHVISRDKPWEASDFQVSSEVCIPFKDRNSHIHSLFIVLPPPFSLF